MSANPGSPGAGGPGGADGGSSAGGGGGGLPSGPPERTDACPRPGEEGWSSIGQSYAHRDLDDSTDGMADDYSSFCGPGTSGARHDVVYPLRIDNRGTLTVTSVPVDGRHPVVYLESECGVRTTFGLRPDELPCSESSDEHIRLGVTEAQQLFLIIEGPEPDGRYQVDLDWTEPTCGDGVINPAEDATETEQCDFGDDGTGGSGGGATVQDGCDASCKFEPVGPNDGNTAPGNPIDTGEWIDGFTTGYSDSYQPSCAPPGGPDRVYSVNVQQAGSALTVTAHADFDVMLALMSGSPPELIACVDSPGYSSEEVLQVAGLANDAYYIVVDGFDETSWGSYQLTAEVTP